MARDDRQPVVHLLSQRTDGLRLGRKLCLRPDRRHRPRYRDEIGRSGEQHPLLEGKVPKRGVMLKRGRKKMLAGHEHDHIVWRIGELVPVILASKRVHMRLHRPAMRRQMGQPRSEEHTSELQSLMRISYAVFCLKQKTY